MHVALCMKVIDSACNSMYITKTCVCNLHGLCMCHACLVLSCSWCAPYICIYSCIHIFSALDLCHTEEIGHASSMTVGQ